MLTLTIPVAEEAKPRKMQVQRGNGAKAVGGGDVVSGSVEQEGPDQRLIPAASAAGPIAPRPAPVITSPGGTSSRQEIAARAATKAATAVSRSPRV